jgi:hypothetical protein
MRVNWRCGKLSIEKYGPQADARGFPDCWSSRPFNTVKCVSALDLGVKPSDWFRVIDSELDGKPL